MLLRGEFLFPLGQWEACLRKVLVPGAWDDCHRRKIPGGY